MQDAVLVVVAVVLVIAFIVGLAFVIHYKTAVSPTPLSLENRLALRTVKLEAEKGILPHIGTYDYVIFSPSGREDIATVNNVLNTIVYEYEENTTWKSSIYAQSNEAYALFCRICMVTNEIDLITNKTGHLNYPVAFKQSLVLVGKAINKQEVFGNFMTVPYESNYEIPIIAFRGTASTQDWLVDANISKCSIAQQFNDNRMQGTVHTGFVNLYLTMCHMIVSQLNIMIESQGSVEYVIITGHSLGAALATLAAFHISFWSNGKIKPVLMTYGSPRVGDQTFATCFTKRRIYAIRVANNEDGVTSIPGGEYKHIGWRKEVDIHPRMVGLPPTYSTHNLYLYLWAFDPQAEDVKMASTFLQLSS